MTKKISIILMSLGGPDKPENIKSFLYNLFNDPLIIRAPNLIRKFLAWFISWRREKTAIEIYNNIGGKSPILENTQAQQESLANILENKFTEIDFQFEIIMRYWHPFCADVIKKIKDFNPDEIILLPMYPQFSTTTSLSSINEFKKYYQTHQLTANLKIVCCFPFEEKFIESQANLLNEYIKKALTKHKLEDIRILFSAHGLPENVIKSGDSYQWQVEEGTKKIIEKIDINNLDVVNCYQSRVGPLKWIGPSTDEEIIRAGQDQKVIILLPIAFVSEHSETLVELDIEYKELVEHHGVIDYYRIPTVSIDPLFIESLSNICSDLINNNNEHNNFYPFKRICDKKYCGCINPNQAM